MPFINCKKCESKFKYEYLIRREYGTPFSGTMGVANCCPVCKSELFMAKVEDPKPL